MQQNRRTVLISILGIVTAFAVMAFVGTRMFGRISENAGRSRDDVTVSSSDGVTLDTTFAEFDSVVIIGGWSLTIIQGSEFSVHVTATERAAEEIEVLQRGSELTLSVASTIRTVTGNFQATIVMPDLVRMQVDGGTTTSIEGFDLDELSLEINGAANLRATDSTIARLVIDVDGAATLDFWESSVANAVLEMDGASKLSVTMDGGELSGVLRGVGDVSYRGPVSSETVKVEGLGRVRRR